jgi:PTH2 family peptidyl-tRNA hydrolase
MTRIKQVILIRRDLKMRRGKEIAQGSHASMDFLIEPLREQLEKDKDARLTLALSAEERQWVEHGMAKVCLQVNSESELLGHHERALAAGLKSYLIEDSGRTEFHGQPTLTACAIGPAEAGKIDVVTGDLALY